MKELQAITDSYRRLSAECQHTALATVVGVQGSAYRRPGARMLIAQDGETTGVLSGGCLEQDVSKRALEVIKLGETRLITYDTSSDQDIVWGLGIGCRGVIQILIEPLSENDDELIQFFERCTIREGCGVLATVISSEGKSDIAVGARAFCSPVDHSVSGVLNPDLFLDISNVALSSKSINRRYLIDRAAVEIFINAIEPVVPLVVFGAGDDVLPVLEFAGGLGWKTTVVDTRARTVSLDRFAAADEVLLVRPEEASSEIQITDRTVVVVMTHNYLHDLELLAWLLHTPARYLGCLGPRARAERLVSELAGGDVELAATYFSRLHAPAGLDIGAENAREIALSIISEIRAVLVDRDGGSLRNRLGPIHEIEGSHERLPSKVELACALKGN
ncbi:MAG TPA: XdhC family protein [Pyrinomonadaceae bacterium]|nr:XdhC family protein [Pyrinomonadaceae bacterium]